MMTFCFSRRDFLQAAVATTLTVTFQSEAQAQTRSFPFVDGLSLNIPDSSGQIKASGLSAFLFDTSSGEQVKADDGSVRFRRSYEATLKSIALTRRKLRSLRNAFFATDGGEIDHAFKTGRTAVFLQVQGGGEIVGEDLDRIDVLREMGLRVLQITHHHNNLLGGGGMEKSPSGLTKLGFDAVARMNSVGIIPDLSHSSDQTALDVLRISKKPVILSHGAARAIVNNARCTPDGVIRGIADSGGVMGVFMMSFWLTTDPHPKVEHYLKQIRHVAKVGGIHAVGIANDFPLSGEQNLIAAKGDNAVAVRNYLPWWDSLAKMGILGFHRRPAHVAIPELNNINRVPLIYNALERSGFKRAELEKIMGGNWKRILTETGNDSSGPHRNKRSHPEELIFRANTIDRG